MNVESLEGSRGGPDYDAKVEQYDVHGCCRIRVQNLVVVERFYQINLVSTLRLFLFHPGLP